MNKIIILYGLAACGKTTQAIKINEEFKLFQFGMGDRLRDEIASGSDLGKKIKSFVDQGILITDDLMAEIISNVGDIIKDQGIIFDGFPRMLAQAVMLEDICNNLDREIDVFFYLKVSPEEALRRIKARAEETGRKDDKDEQAVTNRLNVFKQESQQLIEYYRQKNKLVEIDGEQSIEDVYREIKKHLA